MEKIKTNLPENCSEKRTEDVDVVMIHHCSDCVSNPASPYCVASIVNTFSNLGVSSHYIIDREGAVHQLVEETKVAYHAGKGHMQAWPQRKNTMNAYSIGIELLAVGSARDMHIHMSAEDYAKIPAEHIGYTEAQYAALNELINEICVRHPKVQKNRKHIIGHDEYAPERKTDPGELFDWSKLGL